MNTNKKASINDVNLLAYCGLYCGACAKYLKGKCPGCKENVKAKWCKIRTCNIENSYLNCSECNINSISVCKKLNNPIAKVFQLIFKTDRIASLNYIKENGAAIYCEKMSSLGQMAIKKRQILSK